ncbi:MAG: CpsD/CapB family tyrosine-protein kinase [Thermoguttaceae bacterium]
MLEALKRIQQPGSRGKDESEKNIAEPAVPAIETSDENVAPSATLGATAGLPSSAEITIEQSQDVAYPAESPIETRDVAESAQSAIDAALRHLDMAASAEPDATIATAADPQSSSTAELPAEPPDNGPYGQLAGRILEQLTPSRPAVLLLTSPGDGQGKTTTAWHLAPALAQRSGGEVLLVDANFRNPGLALRCGLGPSPGLPDVLDGTLRWSDAVRPTATPRLALLPGGHRRAGDDWLPLSTPLGWLLRELPRHYPLVLVDAPSLAHPEAAPISSHCEGTYLVVRLGRTTSRLVRQSARLIARCHGRLLGCIAVE